MTAFRIALSSVPSGACGQVGGTPVLPTGSEWPKCRLCEEEMIAFIDIVLPDSGTFQTGSRLQMFLCREHDDIAGTIYSDYTVFDRAGRHEKLPSDYWRINDGHYLIRLSPPSASASLARPELSLVHQFVNLTAASQSDENGFKLFGDPHWLQDPEAHHCSCGAPMSLLLQIPDGQGFPMSNGAQPQPNSFSSKQYCIFLGNQLYLLAWADQCSPLALWPVLQN